MGAWEGNNGNTFQNPRTPQKNSQNRKWALEQDSQVHREQLGFHPFFWSQTQSRAPSCTELLCPLHPLQCVTAAGPPSSVKTVTLPKSVFGILQNLSQARFVWCSLVLSARLCISEENPSKTWPLSVYCVRACDVHVLLPAMLGLSTCLRWDLSGFTAVRKYVPLHDY